MNLISQQDSSLHPSPYIKLIKDLHDRLREPLLTVLLAIQIFSVFIMPALRSVGFVVPRAAVITVLLVFVSLAIILARSRGAMAMLIVSVILTIVGGVWHSETPDFMTDVVSATGQALTDLSLIWVVSTAVFGPGRATHHRILGAVVMYLSIGMMFTSLDMLLVRTIPNAFTHLPSNNFDLRESLNYYSFGALTTGVFGDILPLHPIARSLSNLESICGQLFPATLLARIVSQFGVKQGDDD